MKATPTEGEQDPPYLPAAALTQPLSAMVEHEQADVQEDAEGFA